MSQPTDDILAAGQPPQDAPEDLTGRDRMSANILASWMGHLVFIAGGFVLPRMIDRHVGQAALGVWDFGWSLISYFGLLSAGVASSINRYISRYRAGGDAAGVSVTASTGLAIYACTGAGVLLLTLGAAALVPILCADRLGDYAEDGRWVVLLLGLSCTVQFVFAVFGGIITGCHRWGLHNAITSGVWAAMVVAMIIAMVLGGGLRALATTILVGETITGLLRAWAAHRVCAGLRLSPGRVHWRHARELVGFGGKTILETISRLITYQTSHLLIIAALGPAALALYARPAALIRHAATLLNKFAMVFTPTASAFQASGAEDADSKHEQTQQLPGLLVKGTEYALFISLPMVLVLAITGGAVLQVWMGAHYRQALVLAILAVGHLPSLSQRATYQVLMGLGRHGTAALAMLAASLCSVGLVVVGLWILKWGLVGVALAVVVPLAAVNTVVIPTYACQIMGMPFLRYVNSVVWRPLAANGPLAVCLLAARIVFPDDPIATLAWGLGVGGVITSVVYWRYVVPQSIRTRFRHIGSKALSRRLAPEG